MVKNKYLHTGRFGALILGMRLNLGHPKKKFGHLQPIWIDKQ